MSTKNLQPAFNDAGAHAHDNLLAGDLQAVTESIVVASGENLTRGTLLVKDGTKFAANAAAADATKVYAILAEDTDATDADATTVGYVTGMFNANAVTFGGELALADVQDILRDKGIHFKTNLAA